MKTIPSQAVDSLSHYIKALTLKASTSAVRSAPAESANMSASQQILLTTPVALRQLLSEHQSVHKLLPQLASASAQMTAASPLTALLTHLSTTPDMLHAQQLRALLNQWFSMHPMQMLTSPAVQPSSWLQALAPALLWLLRAKQYSSTRSGTQSAERASPSAQFTLPNLLATLQQIKGSLHSIRLSQLHLTETAAQQQPEYYLCLPYQEQSKETWLELLLKRENRSKTEQSSSRWQFTMRLNLLQEGPVLVRGSYESGQTDIRFYSQSVVGCDRLQQSLNYLRERLLIHGIEHPDLRVYQGNVPESLAPYPKPEYNKDDSYAR